MAHVPGLRHDLFLSYAHTDDPTWIEAFEAALRQGLQDRLGHSPSLWQDAGRLRLGQQWQDEIEQAILQTAAFLAIVSPGYLNSVWCQRERRHFLEREAALERLGPTLEERFLKVIRAPADNRAHELLLPAIQHILFFREGTERTGYMALTPGTDEFKIRMQETTHAIAALLQTMRRSRERVYVATPTEEALPEWEALRAELKVQGFDVRPEGLLDASFADELVKSELDSATLVVFILTGCHDEFIEHQLRFVKELNKRLVIWLHPHSATPSERQRAFLESLRTGDALPPLGAFLEGTTGRDMILEVLDSLKPGRTPPRAPTARENPWVYLLYDPTTALDSRLADTVRDSMEAQQLEVFVPLAGATTATDRLERHQSLLRECDGVLLCRGPAPSPDQWLLQTVPEVLFAEQQLSRPPMLSKGFLLAEPGPLRGWPNVIQLSDTLMPEQLQPFVQPLLSARQADAGR